MSLRGLSKRYGAVDAVQSVSLDIRSGEFFTLLGPSGSGKTTTLMAIAGFVIPDSGSVVIGGAPVERVPPERRNLGIVFQNYALFPHLTVYENLAFPLEMRGARPGEISRRIREILGVVRLEESQERYPSQLSGGQQQRVAVARALIFEPAVLLMDEPLGALDKKLRTHLQIELKHLQRQLGVTVIYVTHDQDEALTMSDRVAVMNRGRVEQVGCPRELYEEPATQFVADFLGESNTLSGILERTLPDWSEVRLGADLVVRGRRSKAAVGSRCTLSIRPERVHIGTECGDARALSGRVVEITYAGEMTRYWIDVPGAGRLLVKRQNNGRGDSPEVGEVVHVGWRSRDCQIFEEAP